MIALSLTSSPTRVLLLFPSAYSITFFFSQKLFFPFLQTVFFLCRLCFHPMKMLKIKFRFEALTAGKKFYHRKPGNVEEDTKT